MEYVAFYVLEPAKVGTHPHLGPVHDQTGNFHVETDFLEPFTPAADVGEVGQIDAALMFYQFVDGRSVRAAEEKQFKGKLVPKWLRLVGHRLKQPIVQVPSSLLGYAIDLAIGPFVLDELGQFQLTTTFEHIENPVKAAVIDLPKLVADGIAFAF